ncbi:import inner membrane translocase subunit Tim16 [Aphelenchoides avenae]|nr:import inner membrane translocase subunit Tim16 [Aphelenchus avenae]
MVWRNVVKVIIAGGEAVGKAFGRAIKEELNAAKRGTQQAAAGASQQQGRTQDDARDQTRTNAKLGITLQESMQILNVKPPLDPTEVEERYKHLFEVNDKSKGGSLYLQSKVYRAKERIDEEFRKMDTEPPAQQQTPPPP